MNKKTIMIVEDEAIIALAEANMLSKYGFEVKTAKDGEKALEIMRNGGVDLILMDIDLGGGKMDGTVTAELILKDREIPIVFCTSHSEKEMVDKVKGITRYGYVLKNSGEFVLTESIHMAFELFDAHRSLEIENAARKESEERLRKRNEFIETILDNLPIGLAVNFIDKGAASYMNREFENVYGWSREELTNIENFFLCVYPDPSYRKKIQDQITADISSGDPKRMQWDGIEVTGKDGTKKIVAAKNIPIPDQNFMISTVQDITEQKKTEEALKNSERRYQILIENIDDIIYCVNTETEEFSYVSPSFERILGYTFDDIQAMGGRKQFLSSVIQQDAFRGQATALDSFRSEKKPQARRYISVWRTKNGEERYIEDNWVPVYDGDRLENTYGVLRDITERVLKEKSIPRT